MLSFNDWLEVLESVGVAGAMGMAFAYILFLRQRDSAVASVGWRNDGGSRCGGKKRNRRRNRDYGLEEMEAMSERDFRKMFRMSRSAFNVLHDKIREDLDERMKLQRKYAINSSGSEISSRTRLAATLRWLAGGSYLEICFEFGIGHGTFYQDDGVLWGTLGIIDDAFEIGLPVNDLHAMERIAEGFASCANGVLKNCVMAIDGWVCKTRQPFASEVDSPMHYRNRHDCFGLVVLAGCDAQKRFLMLSCKNTGSTHDSQAWEMSRMKHALDNNELPEQYYFIGDEAFCCTNQFLVPWSGRGLDPWKDSFNFHLSSMRQTIECAFGMLTQRWGIFWRPLRVSFERWTLIICACAKLHNFCCDLGEGNDKDVPQRRDEDYLDGDTVDVLLNNHPIDVNSDNNVPFARPSGARRRYLTSIIAELGVRRPAHAYRRNDGGNVQL